MDANELRKQIRKAGQRRTRALVNHLHASADLTELIPQAKAAGMSVIEIAHLSEMTRTAVYDVLREHD